MVVQPDGRQHFRDGGGIMASATPALDSVEFDGLKALFVSTVAGLEALAPRPLILAAAQAAIDLERSVDGFVAAADLEDAKG